MSIKRLALIVGAVALSPSAFAAGIDSRSYTCADLHGLIMANGFIFINNSNFQDFVVDKASLCTGGEQVVLLSVPTTDRPECPVNYCGPARGNRSN
jgi:hypothetical protein